MNLGLPNKGAAPNGRLRFGPAPWSFGFFMRPGSAVGELGHWRMSTHSSNNSGEADALSERSRWHGDLYCPPQDAEHAALLIRAAELGSVQAQRDLGCSYATGEDALPQD